MSKKQTEASPAEEEWEDHEEGGEEVEAEDEDTTIANSDVVVRHKKCATWANEVLTAVITLCVPGAKVADVCQAGDKLIADKVKTMFKTAEIKGVAFPTTISVNNCVCHYAPVEGETTSVVFAENDVARIDLGVQVDGYAAYVAHTIVVLPAGAEVPADSKVAQTIAAGHATMEAAVRQLRPGFNTYDVTEMIEKAAENYGLTPVEGVLSHQIRRYIIDGYKTIQCKTAAEHKVHDYEIEPTTVWCLDIVLSTGKGKLREGDVKTGIYKVAIDAKYRPKLDSGRQMMAEIDGKYATFPFAVRNIETKKARLALSEALKHSAVVPFPALFEKEGDIVAHFKTTVLVTEKKIEKITGIPVQKGIAKAAPIADIDLATKAKLPLSLVPKKDKK